MVDFFQLAEPQGSESDRDLKNYKNTVSLLELNETCNNNSFDIVVPPPDKYTLPSDFHSDLKTPAVVTTNIAFTFGMSREVYKKVYSPLKKSQGNEDPSMPGPGTYNPPPKIGNEGRKYTLKGRTPAPNGMILLLINIIRFCCAEAKRGCSWPWIVQT